MSVDQLKSQGVQVAYSANTSPLSFTAIGEIMDVGGPDQNNPVLDSTDMSELAKSFISAGVVDNGQLTLTIGWRPALASHAAIKAALENSTPWWIKITYTDSPQSEELFPVQVTNLGRTFPKEGLIAADVTFKVTGAIE